MEGLRNEGRGDRRPLPERGPVAGDDGVERDAGDVDLHAPHPALVEDGGDGPGGAPYARWRSGAGRQEEDPLRAQAAGAGGDPQALRKAGLDDTVVPVVSNSATAARHWRTPLGMVFIDGGHSLDAALTDYRCWSAHLLQGGILAVHDLFPDPHEGGQAPWGVYRMALDSGLFEEIERVNTLGVLRRL